MAVYEDSVAVVKIALQRCSQGERVECYEFRVYLSTGQCDHDFSPIGEEELPATFHRFKVGVEMF